MGLVLKLAAALAKKAAGTAAAKAKGASKHYCPVTEKRNHRWTKWFNEEHPNTGRTHGPGIHTVWHCADCGFVKE